MDRVRIVVLASGTGTLLQAVVDASADLDYPAEVVGLVTDRPGCQAATRARSDHLRVTEIPPAEFADRAQWDRALADAVESMSPDWVASLGFMRLFGREFLARFPGKVINSHPSLLPAFAGGHAVEETIGYGVKVTGCTVHVVDEGTDTGPVLAQEPIEVLSTDTVESLHERIKRIERRLVVDVIARLASHGYTLEGRRTVL